MKRTRFVLALVALLVSGVAVATSSHEIVQSITASGGGHFESGVYTLDGTIGQPTIGMFSSGPFDLCAGYPGCNIVCYVSVEDIQAMADLWRQAAGPPYDCDGDGAITVIDIMCWAARWGQTCPL